MLIKHFAGIVLGICMILSVPSGAAAQSPQPGFAPASATSGRIIPSFMLDPRTSFERFDAFRPHIGGSRRGGAQRRRREMGALFLDLCTGLSRRVPTSCSQVSDIGIPGCELGSYSLGSAPLVSCRPLKRG